jgi:hypothetical protein
LRAPGNRPLAIRFRTVFGEQPNRTATSPTVINLPAIVDLHSQFGTYELFDILRIYEPLRTYGLFENHSMYAPLRTYGINEKERIYET